MWRREGVGIRTRGGLQSNRYTKIGKNLYSKVYSNLYAIEPLHNWGAGMKGGVGRVMRVGRRGTMNKGNALWKCGDATNGLHIFVRWLSKRRCNGPTWDGTQSTMDRGEGSLHQSSTQCTQNASLPRHRMSLGKDARSTCCTAVYHRRTHHNPGRVGLSPSPPK